MGRLGDIPPVHVGFHLSLKAAAAFKHLITHGEDYLVGDQALVHQVQHQGVGHFPHYHFGLFKAVGPLEHLAAADTVGLRPVALYVLYGAGLPAPGVVYQQLGVDPEELVEKLLVVIVPVSSQGAAGYVPHGAQSHGLQLFGVATAHPPEIRQWFMIP